MIQEEVEGHRESLNAFFCIIDNLGHQFPCYTRIYRRTADKGLSHGKIHSIELGSSLKVALPQTARLPLQEFVEEAENPQAC